VEKKKQPKPKKPPTAPKPKKKASAPRMKTRADSQKDQEQQQEKDDETSASCFHATSPASQSHQHPHRQKHEEENATSSPDYQPAIPKRRTIRTRAAAGHAGKVDFQAPYVDDGSSSDSDQEIENVYVDELRDLTSDKRTQQKKRRNEADPSYRPESNEQLLAESESIKQQAQAEEPKRTASVKRTKKNTPRRAPKTAISSNPNPDGTREPNMRNATPNGFPRTYKHPTVESDPEDKSSQPQETQNLSTPQGKTTGSGSNKVFGKGDLGPATDGV